MRLILDTLSQLRGDVTGEIKGGWEIRGVVLVGRSFGLSLVSAGGGEKVTYASAARGTSVGWKRLLTLVMHLFILILYAHL